jgi:hypothetical protein
VSVDHVGMLGCVLINCLWLVAEFKEKFIKYENYCSNSLPRNSRGCQVDVHGSDIPTFKKRIPGPRPSCPYVFMEEMLH